jgi:hypothetical protein
LKAAHKEFAVSPRRRFWGFAGELAQSDPAKLLSARLRLDALIPVWEHLAEMSGTRNEFSVTCAARMNFRRVKKRIYVN